MNDESLLVYYRSAYALSGCVINKEGFPQTRYARQYVGNYVLVN